MFTGKCLKQLRTKRKMSRKDLSKAIGTSPVYIEQIESGRKNVSRSYLLRLLNALEEDIESFFNGTKSNSKKREKTVLSNNDRRSYKKNITNDCLILKSLRLELGYS